MNYYYIEITDTFSGEANYSWVHRYLVKSVSERGAVQIMAKHYGSGWRNDGHRYNLANACVCMFVEFATALDVKHMLQDRPETICVNFKNLWSK